MYDQARPGDFSQGGRILGPPWELCAPPLERGVPEQPGGGGFLILKDKFCTQILNFQGWAGSSQGGAQYFFPKEMGILSFSACYTYSNIFFIFMEFSRFFFMVKSTIFNPEGGEI